MGEKNERFTVRTTCPHCGAKTGMRDVASTSVTTWVQEPNQPEEGGDYFLVAQCPACDKSVVFHDTWDTLGYGDEFCPKMVYPSVEDSTPNGMPKEIELTYKVALKLRPIDPDSFGNKGRYLLEQICLEQGAEGRFLVEMVQSLADKGLIPDRLAQVASRIRELGNFATHPGKGGVNNLEADTIWKLVRAVVAYVYEVPQLLQEADASKDKLEQQEKALEAKRAESQSAKIGQEANKEGKE